MKKLLFNSLLFLLSFQVFSQGEADNWCFGYGLQLTFNKDTSDLLEIKNRRNIYDAESYASISDAKGDLLFFVLGESVYNRDHKKVIDGLNVYRFANQSVSILQKPNSVSNYYIFSAVADEIMNSQFDRGLYYSEVQVDGDSVMIVSKDNLISNNPIAECITVVPQSTQGKFWLISHGVNSTSNSFFAYNVDENGVTTSPIESKVGQHLNDVINNGNYYQNVHSSIKSNSCYTQIAFSNMFNDKVDVLNFDNSTGNLTSSTSFNNNGGANNLYSVEFSPNGKYLYVAEHVTKQLFQYDLTNFPTAPVSSSKTYLATGTKNRLGQLQLGNNGKIYFVDYSFNYDGRIGVINNPNEKGLDCNVSFIPRQSSPSDDKVLGMGLPNFPKHLVANVAKIYTDKVITCENETLTFELIVDGQDDISGINWSSGVGSFADGQKVSQTFNQNGRYTISTDLTTNCGESQIVSSDIMITKIVDVETNYTDPDFYRCQDSLIRLYDTSTDTAVKSYDLSSLSYGLFESNVKDTFYYSGDVPATITVEARGEVLDTVTGTFSNGASPQINSYTSFEMLQEGKLISADISIYNWGSCANSIFKYELRKDSISGELISEGSIKTTDCKIYSLPINKKLSKGEYFLVYKGKSGQALIHDGAFVFSPKGNEVILVKGIQKSWNAEGGPFSNFVVQKSLPCSLPTGFTITPKCNVLSAFDNTTTNNLSIYPNPSNSSFTIDNSDNTIISLEVYNALGEVIEAIEVSSPQITIGNELNAGAYIVKVHSDDTVGTYRIIKQ